MAKLNLSLRRYFDPWEPRIWEIVPGELYRSRSLGSEELENLHKKYDIKTVISLYPNGKRVEVERDTCNRLGVNFHNINAEVPRDLRDNGQIERLIRIYREGESPFLVHCKDGSDRSGVASFIYLRLFKDIDFSEARKQLSFKYGHMKIFQVSCQNLLKDLEREYENLKKLARVDKVL